MLSSRDGEWGRSAAAVMGAFLSPCPRPILLQRGQVGLQLRGHSLSSESTSVLAVAVVSSFDPEGGCVSGTEEGDDRSTWGLMRE